jgi:hypothetical protein
MYSDFIYAWNSFSKVLFSVALYSKCARALAFETLCEALQDAHILKSALFSGFI